MRKIKLFITASSEGFISSFDNDMEWLIGYPVPSKEDYKTFRDSVDIVLIGGNTYRDMYLMDILWPYQDKNAYVVTRNPLIKKENINIIGDNVIEAIAKLKDEDGKDIWLAGGATLIHSLIEHGLIDEIFITIIPVSLEKGILVFPNISEQSKWKLSSEKRYNNGGILTSYIKE